MRDRQLKIEARLDGGKDGHQPGDFAVLVQGKSASVVGKTRR